MHRPVYVPSPIPIRRPLAQPLTSVLKDGSRPRGRALPRIRALAGVLGTTPNTVARAFRDSCQSRLRCPRALEETRPGWPQRRHRRQ